MPYSIRVSQTGIYPATTHFHFTINAKTWTLTCKLSMPNQWARSRQLSMSTRTLAGKLSMPNQWAESSQLLMSTGH